MGCIGLSATRVVSVVIMLALIISALSMPMLLSGAAHAIDPGEALSDPTLEARARNLSLEFRCLVCQNQSIDDSDAPLARDLRVMVRTRLVAGDTDAEIRTAVTQRYGEFVLFRPRFAGHTLILWLLPLLLLGLGGWLARGVFSRATSSDVE
tara:strand:- start:2712 stop:3167 length:456 start_codon:yes stop_codon:yes gene_type:complete